jgi:hypothetical protein
VTALQVNALLTSRAGLARANTFASVTTRTE